MIILGIDPGTATVGYGVIKKISSTKYTSVGYGIISTKKELPLGDRLVEIARDFKEIIQKYAPDIVGVEELFFFKNVTNAISVAHARGVIMEIIYKNGIPCHEFTPLQIKQAITGYGRASKQQIQTAVQMHLKLTDIPKPDDAADGLATALTVAYNHHQK